MLKIFFWFLVLVNGLLFSYHQGYLEPLVSSGHEPARMGTQMNANQIKPIAASIATAGEPASATGVPDASVTTEPVVASAEKKIDLVACIEIGNFDANEAARFAARLTPLALGDKVSRRDVPDVSTRHIVFIPSQGGKEGADKKTVQLRNLGVKDFYVIQDNTEFQWGISLGIFSTEEAAKTQLAVLAQQGVRSARIQPYSTTPRKIAFQLRQLSAEANAGVEKIKASFPEQKLRNCAAST